MQIFFLTGMADIEPCRKAPEAGKCEPICTKNDGDCPMKRLIRWFFNPHTSNCEHFGYSGCEGGPNNFDTPQSCTQACKKRIMRPERECSCSLTVADWQEAAHTRRHECKRLPQSLHEWMSEPALVGHSKWKFCNWPNFTSMINLG